MLTLIHSVDQTHNKLWSPVHRAGVPPNQWPIQPVNITWVKLEMSLAGPLMETY